ncbi:hypothetical protein Q0812_00725 [Brevundimonas sp. 2R-24]|uniref:Flp pilus-assembly TadG-like N-terminal domain-containing protein n=1 Tax=Peiella sedimenti TaxID=3061083 RepID=A0ABT8SJX9_9CAUL|nr:hypothetical protein [Caulobacteraceae bacterium XZ-24]
MDSSKRRATNGDDGFGRAYPHDDAEALQAGGMMAVFACGSAALTAVIVIAVGGAWLDSRAERAEQRARDAAPQAMLVSTAPAASIP